MGTLNHGKGQGTIYIPDPTKDENLVRANSIPEIHFHSWHSKLTEIVEEYIFNLCLNVKHLINK
jgi:hypothetical protein